MKLKKRKKSSRISGRTHGHSAKLHKGKGSRGGKGMSGSGKRGDQKKTLLTKKYGHGYFGKKGITSRSTAKKRNNVINLKMVMEKYQPGEIDLSKFKILGDGEVKGKFIIKAKAASKSAIEKVKKEGGEIVIGKETVIEKKIEEVEKKKEKK